MTVDPTSIMFGDPRREAAHILDRALAEQALNIPITLGAGDNKIHVALSPHEAVAIAGLISP